MSFAAGLRALLLADTNLAELVDERIYPIVAKQGTELPCVTYQQISGPNLQELTGPAGLQTVRYQFNCFAGTYAEATSVAAALTAALDGYQGTLAGGATIQSSAQEDARDGFEEMPRCYSREVDFEFCIKE